MDPAMLVIILKVVRLRNHQILAKIPKANQAFQDLFVEKEVTTRTGLVTKATFNNVLTKALEEVRETRTRFRTVTEAQEQRQEQRKQTNVDVDL